MRSPGLIDVSPGAFCDERAGRVIRVNVAVLAELLRQHRNALDGLLAAIEPQVFRTHAKRDRLAALQALAINVSNQPFAACRQRDRHTAGPDRLDNSIDEFILGEPMKPATKRDFGW